MIKFKNSNLPENNLFRNKFRHLSSNLYLRGISSSSIKTSKITSKKPSSETNFINNKNLKINFSNNINFNINTTFKNKPFKVFYSENKENALNTNNAKMKLTRTITSYNSKANKLKSNNNIFSTNTDFNNHNYFQKKEVFQTPSQLNKNEEKSEISKSSEKSSSIFITNQINNNKYSDKEYKKISYKGLNGLIDNFGNFIDPLIIPEEDKIFEELTKYNYLTERYNKKYKADTLFKNILIEKKSDKNEKEKKKEKNNENKNENLKDIKNKIIKRNKNENKNILNTFSKTFYKHNHFKITFENKDLLDTLYMTSEDYFKKLNKIKRSKKEKKLNDYQSELLDLIKPTISIYGFNRLKDKFDDIKRQNKVIKRWDIENLKKMIINDINYLYNKYLKNENNKSNYFSKYSPKNFKLELPNIEFNPVFKVEDEEEIQMREYMNKLNNNNNKQIKKIKDSIDKKNINYSIKKVFSSNLFNSESKYKKNALKKGIDTNIKRNRSFCSEKK